MIPLRDENTTKVFPFVTITIILINCAVFIYQYFLGPLGFEKYVMMYGLKPASLMHAEGIPLELSSQTHEIFKIFTSMFMHGGFLHIIMNMWVFWIFGDNIEEAMGAVRFLFFYLICGTAAALTHALVYPNSAIPLVGASGAIAGVMGAYMMLHPMAKVVTLFWFFIFIRIIKVPAFFYLGFWILLQFLYTPMGGPVAYLAHIGGFAAGVLLVFLFIKRKKGFRIIKVKG